MGPRAFAGVFLAAHRISTSPKVRYEGGSWPQEEIRHQSLWKVEKQYLIMGKGRGEQINNQPD